MRRDELQIQIPGERGGHRSEYLGHDGRQVDSDREAGGDAGAYFVGRLVESGDEERPVEAHLAGVLTGRLPAERDVVIVVDGFRSDEAFFEVGVNLSGRLRCGCADGNRPSSNLFLARREIALQPQRPIRLARNLAQRGVLQACIGQRDLRLPRPVDLHFAHRIGRE